MGSWKGLKAILVDGRGLYCLEGFGVWVCDNGGLGASDRCSEGGTETERLWLLLCPGAGVCTPVAECLPGASALLRPLKTGVCGGVI